MQIVEEKMERVKIAYDKSALPESPDIQIAGIFGVMKTYIRH
jgi:hypothetical protein